MSASNPSCPGPFGTNPRACLPCPRKVFSSSVFPALPSPVQTFPMSSRARFCAGALNFVFSMVPSFLFYSLASIMVMLRCTRCTVSPKPSPPRFFFPLIQVGFSSKLSVVLPPFHVLRDQFLFPPWAYLTPLPALAFSRANNASPESNSYFLKQTLNTSFFLFAHVLTSRDLA